MSLESAIDQLLSGDAAVAALVGTRVYNVRAPAATDVPYLVWAIIDSGEVEDHDTDPAASRLSDVLVSVSAYGRTYAEAAALSAAARAAFETSDLVFTIDVPRRDDRDDKLQIFKRDFDLTIWATD